MQTHFVMLATSGGPRHYAAARRLSETAELTDVGPGMFTGSAYVDIRGNAFLPSVKAMAFSVRAILHRPG